MTRLLCITGAPCSGKSTVADLIAARHQTPILSTGRLAQWLAKISPHIVEDQEALAAGRLYPDETRLREAVATWITFMAGQGGHRTLIIDGMPRTADQEIWLASFNHRVIVLDAPLNETWKRWYGRGEARPDSYHRTRWDLWRDVVVELQFEIEKRHNLISNIEDIHQWIRPDATST